MKHPDTPAPAELNREIDRLRAAIAERDSRIRELEEALTDMAYAALNVQAVTGTELQHVALAALVRAIDGARTALSRKGTP